MRAWEIDNFIDKQLRCDHWETNRFMYWNKEGEYWVCIVGDRRITFSSMIEKYLSDLFGCDNVVGYVKLPGRTKDLTWDEARLAWLDGWEVEGGLSFSLTTKWTVDKIVNRTYNLTGGRRT